MITILCVAELASLEAEKRHKALIVDGQNNHAWQEPTPVLKRLLEETRLFQVDVATTPPKGGDMNEVCRFTATRVANHGMNQALLPM